MGECELDAVSAGCRVFYDWAFSNDVLSQGVTSSEEGESLTDGKFIIGVNICEVSEVNGGSNGGVWKV